MSQYSNPVNLIFDDKEGEQFKSLVSKKEFQKLLIITWNKTLIEEQFSSINLDDAKEVKIIEFSHSNPDLEDLYEILTDIEGYNYDLVIGIGGGSVIDIAKSLIAVRNQIVNSKEDLRTVIVDERYKETIEPITLIAVPTTSGTGSEVTSWGTIWDKELTKKYSLTDTNLYASYAFIIPELTIDLPLMTTIATSLDALSHATEAYWSKHTNPISQRLSLQAIEFIINELTSENFDLSSYETRKNLAMGSLLAGLSFSNTRTTACHAISYPLTMKFDIAHGIAVSVTLGKMLEINEPKILSLNELLTAFNVERVEDVQSKLETIYEKFNIKHKLSDYEVKKSDIKPLVEQSFTKGRIDNNPVDLTADQIEAILYSII